MSPVNRTDRYSERTWSLLGQQRKWHLYAAASLIGALVFGIIVRPTAHDVWAIVVIGLLFLGAVACWIRVAFLVVAVVRSAKLDKVDREAGRIPGRPEAV